MHPVVSALKHHKTTVVLVALEIALTCAIVTNALFLIDDRVAAMRVTMGVADDELVWARTALFGEELEPQAQASRVAADLAALRAMPRVRSVAMVNGLPLAGSSWNACVNAHPGGDKQTRLCNVTFYVGTPGFVDTTGIKIAQGRGFLPQEHIDYNPFSNRPPPPSAIIGRALAERLWPGEDPLGRPIYIGFQGTDVIHVVGVTDALLDPGTRNREDAGLSLLLPVTSVFGGIYVLRTTPDGRDAVQRDLQRVLDSVDDTRIVTDNYRYTDSIRNYYRGDRAMVWLLLVVIGCLLALTALGVVGLSSFWVQQRTRTIGIRRAIGATRRDILRYFQVENFLIVGAGVVLGSVGAVALNLFLMRHYELPRLPLPWLAAGAALLWLLGQIAVLGPALRAARVPPVVATRSV